MKNFRFIGALLLFLSLSPHHATAQIFQIPADYKTVKDTVKQFGKGDTLVIGYDSVYLLNQTQLRYYQLLMKLKIAVSQDNTNIEKLFKDLLQSLSGDLTKLESLSKQMQTNADSTGAVGMRLATTTLTNVAKTNTLIGTAQVLLDSAQMRLKEADLHLEKAETLIRQEKKQRWWRNLKWTGVGVLAGIIVRSAIRK